MHQIKHTTQEQIDEMRKEILCEKQKISEKRRPTAGGKLSLPKRRIALKTAGWVVFLFITLLLIEALVTINIAKSKGDIPSVLYWKFRYDLQ